MESKETKVNQNLNASAPKWLLWIGLAISLVGIFVPGQFCADSCSFTAPNFLLLTVGLVLLGVSLLAFARTNPGNRVALKVGAAISFLLALNSATLAINGWFTLLLAMVELTALPIVIFWFIVRVIARSVGKRRTAHSAGVVADAATDSSE
jgi:hypothetical protein